MAYRFKKAGRYGRTYIKAWRLAAGLSQEKLGADMGTTGATVSDVENGKRPYTQDFLEAMADVLPLPCTPADLISRNPRDPQNPIDQAIALLQKSRP
jgi:transcriptional regulator with XRE-family HTH domain